MTRKNSLIVALTLCSSPSFAASADSMGEGDKNPKAPIMEQSTQIWSEPLMGFGVKTNDVYTDGHVFLTVPIWSTIGRDNSLGGDYIFLEPYSSLGEQGEVAASLGLSWRHLFSHESVSALHKEGEASFMEEGWFLGANVFLDMLDTQHNNNFWQMGVGAEVGSRYLDLRGNYYIPMTSEKLYDRQVRSQSFSATNSSTSYNTITDYGTPYATGNTIAQPATSQVFATTSTATTTTTVRTVTELFEKGMEGWDAEASVLVPWLDQWMDLRIIGGYFSFNNQPFGPADGPTGPVHGWKAGAELRPVPAVVLGSMWYEDKRFVGSNWIVSAELQIPMDRTWRDAFTMRRRHLVERLAEPVHRQNDAIKVGNREDDQTTVSSSTSVKRVTRVVSQSSTQLVLKDDIIFVNNGGPVGNGIQAGSSTGTGTAEHPVNTIQTGANIAVTNNATTGRVWNVYTQQSSSAGPYIENVSITGSTNFISSGTLIPILGGGSFGTGVKPTIMGTFSTAVSPPGFTTFSRPISGSSIGYVGITAYQIVAASEAPAINLRNVNSIVLANNYVTNPNGAGIRIDISQNTTSTALISGNLIDQTTLCSCYDAIQLAATAHSALTANILGNQITNTGGSGIYAGAGGGSILNFNASGNLISNAGIDGITLKVKGKPTLLVANILGNTITGSGVDAGPETAEGSGIAIYLANSGRGKITLQENAITNNEANGLYYEVDSAAMGNLTTSGNIFSGNQRSGASLVVANQGHSLFSSTNDHFDGNQKAGLVAFAGGDASLKFSSTGGSFADNGGAGLHMEASEGANILSSTITGASISGNGTRALDLSTSTGATIAMTVASSDIVSETGEGILVRVGAGTDVPAPIVNVLLQLTDDSIRVSGKGATGIDMYSNDNGVGSLVMENTTLKVDSPSSTGINFVAGGSAGTGPNLSATISSSTITTTGEGAAISATASNDAGIAMVVQDSTIHSAGDAVVAEAHDGAYLSIDAEHNFIIDAGTGFSITATESAHVMSLVKKNNINTSFTGIFLNEGTQATLDANVLHNTITFSGAGGRGISFDEAGLSIQSDFDYNTITGGTTGIGVARYGGSDYTAVIKGNTITGTNGSGITLISNGADFKATVTDSLVTDVIKNGLNVVGSSANKLRISVGGNTITNSGQIGISFSADSGNIKASSLDNNTVTGSGVQTLNANSQSSGSLQINGVTVGLPTTLP